MTEDQKKELEVVKVLIEQFKAEVVNIEVAELLDLEVECFNGYPIGFIDEMTNLVWAGYCLAKDPFGKVGEQHV